MTEPAAADDFCHSYRLVTGYKEQQYSTGEDDQPKKSKDDQYLCERALFLLTPGLSIELDQFAHNR